MADLTSDVHSPEARAALAFAVAVVIQHGGVLAVTEEEIANALTKEIELSQVDSPVPTWVIKVTDG